MLMNGQVVVGSDTSTSLSASDQAIGRSDDGNAGPPSRSATAENMALAAEAAGRYGKKR
jgi:hypothetical protein